jgi:hypothetical protein
MTMSTKPGDDDENAWNDRHFQHVYLWLTLNPNSPYVSSPAMLLTAMGIDKVYWSSFRTGFNRADLHRYRFSVRVSLTSRFKRVLNGEYTPIVLRRDKNNRITKYEIKPAENPQPLPCPAFYRGSIKITNKGLICTLRRSEATMAPKHDPEGRNRLLNAFQG